MRAPADELRGQPTSSSWRLDALGRRSAHRNPRRSSRGVRRSARLVAVSGSLPRGASARSCSATLSERRRRFGARRRSKRANRRWRFGARSRTRCRIGVCRSRRSRSASSRKSSMSTPRLMELERREQGLGDREVHVEGVAGRASRHTARCARVTREDLGADGRTRRGSSFSTARRISSGTSSLAR